MAKKSTITLAGLIVLAMILSGCGMGAEETATPEVESDVESLVSVTGEVVPEVWATLSAQTDGTVVNVLVVQGAEVATGDVLIQLDPTDAQRALEEAEAALAASRAQLALVRAGPRNEQLAVAKAEVEVAQAAVAQAVARQDQSRSGATETEIAAAQAQVTAAQADQLAARETHEQTIQCYGFTWPDGTEDSICPLLGPIEEQARYRAQVTDETLDAVQAQLDALQAGAHEARRAADEAVQAAEARQEVAEAQMALLQAGASAEEIAVAEAAVAQAQAALDAAQVALERTEVRAPLAGTVGAVHVRTGELVVPGQALLTVGDLSTLRIETTDLDEIDVARVAVGQVATVTFDALSDRTFSARVTRISPMAEPGTGGVHFTVIVELDEADSGAGLIRRTVPVRWGMTAFVDIEVSH